MQKLTKQTQKILNKILNDVINGNPYCLIFQQIELTSEQKKKLEEDLKYRYELFTRSWIISPIKRLLNEKKE